jgi:hypothetical protein
MRRETDGSAKTFIVSSTLDLPPCIAVFERLPGLPIPHGVICADPLASQGVPSIGNDPDSCQWRCAGALESVA